MQPRTTGLEVASPAVVWALPHQSAKEKQKQTNTKP